MYLAREAIELLGQTARILWFEGAKHGLRDREWMALRFLSRANRFSRTPSALASYVGTTRATASFIIGELERLGYIERKRSAMDKRSVLLSVTQQGKKFLVRDPISVLLEGHCRSRRRGQDSLSRHTPARARSGRCGRTAAPYRRLQAMHLPPRRSHHHGQQDDRRVQLPPVSGADRGGGGRSAMHQLRASPQIEVALDQGVALRDE